MGLRLYDPKNPRRTYRSEQGWFGLLDEFGPSGLRRAFIAAGVTPQVAGNLVWFLEDQIALDRHLSATSRTRYRDALDELDPEKVRRLGRAIPGQFKSGHAA